MKKNKIYVIARNFTDANGEPKIGGVETYIQTLAEGLSCSFDFIIVQNSDEKAEMRFPYFSVLCSGHQSIDKVHDVVLELVNEGELILFSTEQWACFPQHEPSMVIQHGIYWDLPNEYVTRRWLAKMLPFPYKLFQSLTNLRKIKGFKKVICVDYIYPAWYSTLKNGNNYKKIDVIPNFSNFEVTTENPGFKYKNKIKVLFARRFVNIRGVDIAIELYNYFKEHDTEVIIDFVGDGPEKEKIEASGAVTRKVQVKDMCDVIDDSDIVIVPSLGSEGTSLIAIEAMARGKYVIASNVGGLTNIIIHGYNAALVKPCVNEFIAHIQYLKDNESVYKRVCDNAKQVVNSSLNKDVWIERWKGVLSEYV